MSSLQGNMGKLYTPPILRVSRSTSRPRLSGTAYSFRLKLDLRAPPNATSPCSALNLAIRSSISGRKFLMRPLVVVQKVSTLDRQSDVQPQDQNSLDRPGGSIAQCTNSVSFDLLGQFLQHVDFTLLSSSLGHSGHHVVHPCRSLSAGCTLTTRLVLVE